jgi:DNA-binding beta-propeller fold protein YncE
MMGRRTGSGLVRAAVVAAVLSGATASSGATSSVELYVSDVSGGTIERVDPSEGTVGPGIPVSQGVLDIDITPDVRTAYAVSGLMNTVVPVDLETSTADAPISLTCGTQMAIVPGRQKAYVTQACGTTVTPLDLSTNTPGTPIEVGPAPFGVAVTPDGSTAYVATGGGQVGSTDALVPIDVDTDTPGIPIPIGTEGEPRSVVITPDGSTAFVAMEQDDAVVPVDLIAGTAETPIAVSINPVWLALTPDASTLFVTHNSLVPNGLGGPDPTDVTPIDVSSRTALPDIVVGSATTGVVVTPDGTTAYVAVLADSDTPSEVVPIDVETLAAGTPIVVPGDSYALALRPQPSDDTAPPTLAPTVTGSGPGGAVLLHDSAAVAQANADDGTGSGVASSSCGTTDVSTVGPRTLTCTATDVAGNTATADVTYVVQYRLVGLTPAAGTSVRAGKPLKLAVSLADANGNSAALCGGCTVDVRMVAVGGSGQNDGPFAMTLHNGSGEYRYTWKPSPAGLGTTRIVFSVRYPGTAVATSAETLVTVT